MPPLLPTIMALNSPVDALPRSADEHQMPCGSQVPLECRGRATAMIPLLTDGVKSSLAVLRRRDSNAPAFWTICDGG